MKKMEVVRKLLTYIGKDAEEDRVIADSIWASSKRSWTEDGQRRR